MDSKNKEVMVMDLVSLDLSDCICFMVNAKNDELHRERLQLLQTLSTEEAKTLPPLTYMKFPEAQAKLEEAFLTYSSEFDENKNLQTRHNSVLKFLSENIDRFNIATDSNYMRKIFNECDGKWSVDKKVVKAQIEWFRLLRIRAEYLGYQDDHTHDLRSFCFTCGSHATKKCSMCRHVKYCGRKCQQQNWDIHKKFCKGFVSK